VSGYDFTNHSIKDGDGYRPAKDMREAMIDGLEQHACCFSEEEAEAAVGALIAEVNLSMAEKLLNRAVSAYRMHDKLLNDQSRAHERAIAVGELTAFRDALCIVHGWDPAEHGDKEGRADEMVIARWQERYPEEWA